MNAVVVYTDEDGDLFYEEYEEEGSARESLDSHLAIGRKAILILGEDLDISDFT